MKKGKVGKKVKHKTKRKGSLSSDEDQVSVSTSLPPAVEGQLRCFLSLSVSKFIWAAEKHPKDVLIRVCWWGEQGQGTIIRPLTTDKEDPKGISPSTKWCPVRYPVCSGPKQFAAYLNDMGTLLLETIHASTHIPFGKAMISEITKLTASQPINVVVPVMSVIRPFNKLADIQVFIKFESVSAAYNKLPSSIPTVDTGLDKENVDISNPQPTPPPYLNPATPVSHPRHLTDLFESPAPTKGVKFSEEPPERLEYALEPSLLSLGDSTEKPLTQHQQHVQDLGTVEDKSFVQDICLKEDVISTQEPVSERGTTKLTADTPSLDGTDWIGALLERGQRLREGLAISTLLDSNTTGSFLDQHNSPERHTLPGRLFKEILSSNKQPVLNNVHSQVHDLSSVKPVTSEDKILDLLLGDQLDVEFNENLSIISDVSELSEFGDPLHDESLLMDLFYKSQSKKSSEQNQSVSTDEELDSTLTNESIEDYKHTKAKQTSTLTKKLTSHHNKKKDEDKTASKRITTEENEPESSSQSLDPPSDMSGGTDTITSSLIEEPTKPLPRLVQQLGADALTMLGRVNTARVIVDQLEMSDVDIVGKLSDGKKPSTFFVEYYFPISSNKNAVKNATIATEVTRAASKKIQNKGVLFNHRSVFPVSFDATVLEQWWSFDMTFRIFKRESGQKQPIELGVGVFPLKAVLSSNTLSHAHLVELKHPALAKPQDVDSTLSHSSSTSMGYQPSDSDDTTRPCRSGIIGTLEASVELGVDGKAVHVKHCSLTMSTQDSRPALEHGTTTSVTMVSRPVVISNTHPSSHKESQDVLATKPPLPNTLNRPRSSVKEPSIEDPAELLTLHSLLWIPDGKGITLEPHGSQGNQVTIPGISGRTNLFLVSRMFWCEDVSKSAICWGASNPQFGFKQVAPVLLTPTLLQRTCNNFMVIEVWHKVIPQGEQLIGIVKLPLHQLYLSYRDPKITKTLMKSKFPVICVDDVFSIHNPFTSAVHGELKVLLAMGTEEQISSLLAMKGVNSGIARSIDEAPGGQHNRPAHHLDQPSRETGSSKPGISPKKSFALDHQFEITVGDVRGLSVFNSTVWGETDCYVKYHFPHQHSMTQDFNHEVTPGLKSHHTPTTLCVPDPSFQDTTHHSFVLPSGVPVQRYLLAAYSGSWTSVSSVPGSGGVPFELWRRYYYPNVRDQLVAKASLPVAKLCAMVTMQRHREPSVQAFSLPLVVLPDDQGTRQDSGLLEITVKYQAKRMQPDENVKTRHIEDHVSLSVDIIKACGLKDAATIHSHTNPTLSYPADVGVNCYVVIKLPIGRKTKYITRTVARTFTPDFSHHLDIMVPLTSKTHGADDEHEGELVSLAERLETSEAVFEVWHQHSRGLGNIESNTDHGTHKSRKKDVLLGVVSIPLLELLTKRTGIRGWHSIRPATNNLDSDSNSTHNTLGGLQLSIKLEDPTDRETVVHVGRGLRWSLPGVEYDDDIKLLRSDDDDNDDEQYSPKGLDLSLKISRAWVPVSLVQDHLGPSRQSKEIKGYIRYKLYDKSPLCSRVVPIRPTDHEISILEVKHMKSFIVLATSSLVWYLREETLEVQVWLRGQSRKDKVGADGHVLPGQRDKLVGSAFIDLSSLVVPDLRKSQISGVFPLFKAGADAMDGASVHVQVILSKPNTSSHHQVQEDAAALDDTVSSDDYPSTRQFPDHDSTTLKSSSGSHPSDGRDDSSFPQTPPRPKSTAENDKQDTFAAHVIVQEAHHLPTETKDHMQRVSPNVYVTYQTSSTSSIIRTPLMKSSTKPVWEFQKLERLPLATLKTQNLVFKVWHRPEHQDETLTKVPSKKKKEDKSDLSSGDYCLGFVSVDLAPLAAGMRQLIGWYNIMDFNGECKGQIKVGVVPLAPVSPSRCLPRSRFHVNPAGSSVDQHAMPPYERSIEQPNFDDASGVISSRPLLLQHENLQNPDSKWHADKEDHLEFNYREKMLTQTSTSFLFKQLKQNMQDLDNLQKGLQSKLKSPDSSKPVGFLPLDKVTHPAVSTGDLGLVSSHVCVSSTEHTHPVWVVNTTNVTDSQPVIKSHTYQKTDLPKETSLFDSEHVERESTTTNHASDLLKRVSSPSSPEALGDNAFDRDLLHNDKTINDADTNINLETDRIAIQEEQLQEHSHIEEISDTDSFAKEYSPEKDLYPSYSLEEVSNCDKTELNSPFKFTQEIDSWLSSGEDEETKTPMTAQAFFLPDIAHNPLVLKQVVQKSDGIIPGLETDHKESCNTVNVGSHSDNFVEAMNVFKTPQPQNQKGHDSSEEAMNVFKTTQPKKQEVYDSSEEIPNVVNEDLSQHEFLSDNDSTGDEKSPIDSKDDYFTTNSTTKDTEARSKPKGISLPNFFMPTQQLENSMRALRLGAKLGYPNSLTNNLPQSKLLERTLKSKDEDERRGEMEGILSQFSRKKVLYKAKQDMQAPLSSIELDRIAKIFSSKEKDIS